MAAKKAPSNTRTTSATPASVERRPICNLVPSRDTERDWPVSAAVRAGSVAMAAALPPSVDLRDPAWPVGQQGSTGSCVGWATADGVLRYHFAKAGRTTLATELSTRFIWMASKETDTIVQRPTTFIEEAGTMLKNALEIARKYGAVPAGDLPFQVNTFMSLEDEATFFSLASQLKIASYYNMRLDLAEWKRWLASQGPILVGLNVDATWDDAKATKGKLDTFQASTARGGHAVAVVGYRKDGRFILRNSWGDDFGDGGFAYASPKYIKAAFFDEAYGVTI